MRCTIFLVLVLLTLKCANCLEVRTPRIAIIGGGIGGASTSHFLTELMNEKLEIDLYEAKLIGGRLATVNIKNNKYEAGGAIIHPKNMYMQKFVKLLGLKGIVPNEGKGKIGIWNGDEFVFKNNDYAIISLVKLLYRYGFQVFKLKRDVNDIIGDFGKIYELQDAGKYFVNITALLSAINEKFPKWLQISLKDRLLHMGYTERLIDELVEATVLVNYGQDTDVQTFVGFTSLAGVGSDLWAVEGGNKRVPEYLIYRNKNINVKWPCRVTKVRYMVDNGDPQQYEVTYTSRDSTDPVTAKYDIVIIATPLTSDQEFPIEFVDFPEDLEFPDNYQTTHATFIKADIKPKYFNLHDSLDSIFSCNSTKTIISSIGRVSSVNGSNEDGSPVWKIFSRKSLETDLIHEIFSNVIEKKAFVWKAYPHYLSNTRHNNFKLHDALYHVNAVEWIASAMEMSAISGRNIAILAYNDFLQKYGLMQHNEAPKNIPKTLKKEL